MDKIFSEIISMSLDSVWLVVAVIIVRTVLRKAPMYFRKILWALVGLRLLIPFSFESVFSLVPHEVQQTTVRVADHLDSVSVEKGLSFSDAIPYMWIIIAAAFLVYGLISYIRLKLKIIDSILIEGNIYRCDRIDSPFVCGFIKPKIYLPYGLDEKTQNCVLQHERTHIKFADHIIKAVSFIVLCIHWFNPLVWVSYFLLCKDIELSCDESVIKKYSGAECKEYAKALLELGVNKVKFTACPVAFGEVSIKTRIKSVINYKKASKFIVFASLCLCVAVSVCFMTEPAAKAKESEAKQEEIVVEETTEPETEKVTETTTEVTTEPTTELETESVAQLTEIETQYQNPVETTEEAFDDSMFENEADGLESDALNTINIQKPDLYDPPSPTSPYEGVSYNNYGSNSSVVGNKPSNTVSLPSFNWDPAVTVQGGHNYQHTRPYNPNNQFNMW